MSSPTARTLDLLRRSGYLCAVVETWIPRIERRRDLFGFADVLAVHPRDRVFLLVQATTTSNVSARLAKARSRPALPLWLRAGGRFEVWGWSRRGKTWEVKRVEVQGDDLELIVLQSPRRKRRESKQLLLFAGTADGAGGTNDR